MKSFVRITCICFLLLALAACAGSSAVRMPEQITTQTTTEQVNTEQTTLPKDSLNLDEAITGAVAYFIPRLPEKAKIALVSFDAASALLSEYIIAEMWRGFEDSGKFIMVDRRNLDRIDDEINYQLGSGKVDDTTAVSISRQYGAEILVYGQILAIGQGSSAAEYRLSIYATDVEKAASSQRAYTIKADSRLNSLLNSSAEDEVDRAVSAMAQTINQKTTVAVGRISFVGTETVSGFSAWLKNRLIASAQKQREKFQVASRDESSDLATLSRGLTVVVPEGGSPIQAVIAGHYSPLDSGAEVSLYLVSTTGNRMVLASSQFVIPSSELERRRLSLLPEKDTDHISLDEFQAKQQVVSSYAGDDNEWTFTITPGVLDGIYYDGDFMYMSLFSSKNCYFRIIHIDVDGNTQVIYPVAALDNNFLKGGETRSIPDNTLYLMKAPFGEEIILAAAYTEPFANDASGAGPLSEEIISRSFTVETRSAETMTPSATAKFSYTILPR